MSHPKFASFAQRELERNLDLNIPTSVFSGTILDSAAWF